VSFECSVFRVTSASLAACALSPVLRHENTWLLNLVPGLALATHLRKMNPAGLGAAWNAVGGGDTMGFECSVFRSGCFSDDNETCQQIFSSPLSEASNSASS
jgi:hypothetical protein